MVSGDRFGMMQGVYVLVAQAEIFRQLCSRAYGVEQHPPAVDATQSIEVARGAGPPCAAVPLQLVHEERRDRKALSQSAQGRDEWGCRAGAPGISVH